MHAEEYDVVIVGGGLAGLCAAATLANSDLRVVLYEKGPIEGGKAITEVDKDFQINIGHHGLLRKGPGASILKGLGLEIAAGLQKPGGYTVLDDRRRRLPVHMGSALFNGAFNASDRIAVYNALRRVRGDRTKDLMARSATEWVASVSTRPKVQRWLHAMLRWASYTNNPDELSAGLGVEQLQRLLRGGLLHVEQGWEGLTTALRGRARTGGVELRRKMGVASVSRAESGLDITLEKGTVVRSRFVVLAVDPTVAAGLVPSVDTASWAGPGVRVACFDVGLSELPDPPVSFGLALDGPYMFNVVSHYAGLAPPGGTLVSAVKYLGTAAANESTDRAELEAFLESLQRGWAAHMVTSRYLPEKTVTRSHYGPGSSRPDVEVSEMPGLYVAGDWVGPTGWLVDAALSSAHEAANQIRSQGR